MVQAPSNMDEYSSDLKKVLGRAVRISEGAYNNIKITFTSVFLAINISMDTTSKWLQEYLNKEKIKVNQIRKQFGISAKKYENIRTQEFNAIAFHPQVEFSQSAEIIFNHAQRIRYLTSGENNILDVRHYLGAYIYSSGHEHDLKKWNIRREDWSNSFLSFIRTLYPHELERWIEVHKNRFKTEPNIEPVGISTYIHGDYWTVNDELGYDYYSHAIFRFITSKNTDSPLTISIQAPWGAGKTSLMRMIQKKLDPEALGNYLDQKTRKRYQISKQFLKKLKKEEFSFDLKETLNNIDYYKLRTIPELERNIKIPDSKIKSQTFTISPGHSIRHDPYFVGEWALFKSIEILSGRLLDEGEKEILSESALIDDRSNVKEIRQWIIDYNKDLDVEPDLTYLRDEGTECLTIWFNVWKYENTEQVWAGLVDSIIRQVTSRLSDSDRERFFLNLHLRRGNIREINQQIEECKIASWTYRTNYLKYSMAASIALLTGAVASSANASIDVQSIHYMLSTVPGLSGIITGSYARHNLQNENAEICLGKYVQIPDYNTKLGFLHHAEEDLRRVLDLIPNVGKPIVIFIDDIDRCSPQKIADVIEAINLFLGGEFKDCIFVLGMDTEMVAAALNAAHSDVISQLPEDKTGTPVGWRFMDKFVQLPFVIPPASREDLHNYADSLLSKDLEASRLDELFSLVQDYENAENDETADKELEQKMDKGKFNEEEQNRIKGIIRKRKHLREMDNLIKKFSDDEDARIRDFVLSAAEEFSRNPREVKRFFNLFRFYLFIKSAREVRGLTNPLDEQLQYWITLSLKWPQVVRWIQRGSGSEEDQQTEEDINEDPEALRRRMCEKAGPESRLKQLEDICDKSNTFELWSKEIQDKFRLDPFKTPWVGDESLFHFFKKILCILEDKRLSTAEGTGFW